jgi:hypothetical protein
MNVKYEHIGIALGVFLAVSGIIFCVNTLLPQYDYFEIECTTDTINTNADLWCQPKKGDLSHTFYANKI